MKIRERYFLEISFLVYNIFITQLNIICTKKSNFFVHFCKISFKNELTILIISSNLSPIKLFLNSTTSLTSFSSLKLAPYYQIWASRRMMKHILHRQPP